MTSAYNETQQRIIGILPLITAPLSVAGSLLIIADIFQNWQTALKKKVYYRIMLGLSVMDLIVSLFGTLVFGPWAVPAGVGYSYNERGNWATCAASGFFINFMYGTVLYSTFLALYFCLSVRFEIKERIIARRIEPFMHLIAILFPIVTGVIGVTNNFMNPMEVYSGFCWMVLFPANCGATPGTCTRGPKSLSGMASLGFAATAWVSVVYSSWIIIFISMLMILIKVRRTELRMNRYAARGAKNGSNNRLRRTKETGKQALSYIGFFFLCYIDKTVALIIHNSMGYEESRLPMFMVALFGSIFGPLQGFFNAFIYFRKKFRSVPEQSSSNFMRRFLAPSGAEKTISRTPPLGGGSSSGGGEAKANSAASSTATIVPPASTSNFRSSIASTAFSCSTGERDSITKVHSLTTTRDEVPLASRTAEPSSPLNTAHLNSPSNTNLELPSVAREYREHQEHQTGEHPEHPEQETCEEQDAEDLCAQLHKYNLKRYG